MTRLKTLFTPRKAEANAQTWLLLGGTGTISTGVVQLLLSSHLSVTCINRGSRPMPPGVEVLIGDVNSDEDMKMLLTGRHFDVVVDFLTYSPDQAEKRIAHFTGKCGRYVFISTAMTYEKPPRTLFVSEKTPQDNPFSPYAQNKTRCEGLFRQALTTAGFPVTIIRPSFTYGDRSIPFILNSDAHPYTLVDRLRRGKPILVPGDGSVFWTITHNSDFARALLGLMRLPETVGEDFHLTTDECMTWDAFLETLAQAAAAPAPRIVHVATDRLVEEDPRLREALLGDKAQTAVFDNSKLRAYLPDFRFLMSYRDGVRRSLANFDTHPELRAIDEAWNAWVDGVIARHGE